MKDSLAYLKLANTYGSLTEGDLPYHVAIRLITNFTDEPLQKILIGMCLDEKIYPSIETVPYKQYHLYLKQASKKSQSTAEITFIFLDVHNYAHGAFHSVPTHFDEILDDVERLCAGEKGPVVMSTFPLPYQGAYGNLLKEDEFYQKVITANKKLEALASAITNLHVLDINRLIHGYGEARARDFRSLYSADIPFTTDFFVVLALEWLDYIYAQLGRTKKCLVLDLDNTLWGGIVGEVGPSGIELGSEYPGLAYQNFQRALLQFYNRGIILAINSRNNPADVEEVFKKNPNMILKPEHFAAVRINWNNKAQNIVELAEELNIGTDTMVFIDDDAMNRDLVKNKLPEVQVPEWNIPPSDYVPTLLFLRHFYQFGLTDEDKKKGQMYAQERQRKIVHDSTGDIDDYIAALGIQLAMSINNPALIPRLSQMTLKTNQYNLTTKRYGEKEIADLISNGAWIFSADVSDKFGEYGTTILAIVTRKKEHAAYLDTFLMSCRVMGRGVEYSFMDFILRTLRDAGIKTLDAEFIPSAKNMPAKDFLPSFDIKESGGAYHFDLNQYFTRPPQTLNSSIAVGTVV